MMSTDGIPKSSVAVSAMGLIAGGVAAVIVVLGLVFIIILLVALFVHQKKHKVHATNNRDLTYPNPVFESKWAMDSSMRMDSSNFLSLHLSQEM